jgi:hypothetical protein
MHLLSRGLGHRPFTASTPVRIRVGADTAEEARRLLQQLHEPRSVPYLPRMIPG